MFDDKSKTDNRDRKSVTGSDNRAIHDLVMKAGIKRYQARELIMRYGNDRETLMKHARKLA